MDEIKNDENSVEELDDEEIETFERGETLDPLERPDEMHTFGGEAEDEASFGSDFDEDEMAYVTEAADERRGFFSRMFKPAILSVGVLGVLLVALIILFLFMPRGADIAGEKDTAKIEKRLADIEEQIFILQDAVKKKAGQPAAMPDPQTGKRLEYLEKEVSAETAGLKNEINSLAAAVNEIKYELAAVKPPVEKAAEKIQEKTPVKAPTKKTPPLGEVKYYTVKKGDNPYRIAVNHGLTEKQLLELNGLKKNSTIHPGDRLIVNP